jgi:hypothetical protein
MHYFGTCFGATSASSAGHRFGRDCFGDQTQVRDQALLATDQGERIFKKGRSA